MKLVSITLPLSLFAVLAQAAPLPEGSFKGEGLWKNAEQRGRYEVSTEIMGDSVNSIYSIPEGGTREWKMDLKQEANGFFEVISNGKVVGKGYCLDYVSLCHYEVKTPELELEETLTHQNGKLYKFGSKTFGGVRTMWQEALEK